MGSSKKAPGWWEGARAFFFATVPALRCGGGIVLSSWVMCGSDFSDYLGGTGFLAPVIAVLLAAPTLGSSIMGLFSALGGAILSIIASSIFLYFVLLVETQPGKAILFVFFLFTYAFLIQISSFSVVFKKLGMIIAVILMASVYLNGIPDDNPLFSRDEVERAPKEIFPQLYQNSINLILAIIVGGLSAQIFLIFPRSATASARLRRELCESMEKGGELLKEVVTLYSETPSCNYHCLRAKIEDGEAKVRATLSAWEALLVHVWWEQKIGLLISPFVRFGLTFFPRFGAPPQREEGEELTNKKGLDWRECGGFGCWFLWAFPFFGDVTVPVCSSCLLIYKEKMLDLLLFITTMREIIEKLAFQSGAKAYFSAQIQEIMEKTTDDSAWHLNAISEFYSAHSLTFYSVHAVHFRESCMKFMDSVQRARMVVGYGAPMVAGERAEDFVDKPRVISKPLPLKISQINGEEIEQQEKGKEKEGEETSKSVCFIEIEDVEDPFDNNDNDNDPQEGDQYENPKYSQQKKSKFEFSQSSWGAIRLLNPFCFAFRSATRIVEEMTLISSDCKRCCPKGKENKEENQERYNFTKKRSSSPPPNCISSFFELFLGVFRFFFEYFSQFFVCIPHMREQKRKFFLSREFIGSFQFAVAIALALLIIEIPGLSDLFSNQHWAALTVAFVMERGSMRGSFFTCVLRLIGTVAGSLAGYFTLLAVEDYQAAELLLMFLWTVACGYVKGSAKYSYAGVVATFTFPIILYGGEDDDEVQDSALSRIELTFIGICCVIIASFFAPVSAQTLLIQEQTSLLSQLKSEIRGGCDAYLQVDTFVEPQRVLALRKIRGSLLRQSELIKEAEGEPELCAGEFSSAPFRSLLFAELEIVQAIVVMHKCIAIPHQGRGLEQFPLVIDRVAAQYEQVRDALVNMVDSLLLLFLEEISLWEKDDDEESQFVLIAVEESFEELQDSIVLALSDVVGNVDSLGPLSTAAALTIFQIQLALGLITSEGNNMWKYGIEVLARREGYL